MLGGLTFASCRTAMDLKGANGESTKPNSEANNVDEESSSTRLNLVGVGSPSVDLINAPKITEGPFLGGATGTHADAQVELKTATFTGANVPSGGIASPLFAATPWSQNLLLFEEFGTEPLAASPTATTLPLPQASVDSNSLEQSPVDIRSAPNGQQLENFLAGQGLSPFPTRVSNTTQKNPWWSLICGYIKTANCLGTPGPIEGRPPAEGWAHQRWAEFFPEKFFKTAQVGARTNLGFRNSRQLHGYRLGEFGPGGLYYNTLGKPGFDATTKGIKVQFHPNFPVQNHKSVWTFDGTMPPKLLMARYGEPILMRHFNALPIDVSANSGFGLHTITTHEHNGHNPAESDGYAGAFFFPGQFYDYRWPLTLAGTDTMNTGATEAKAATPCKAGEVMRVLRGTAPVAVTCDVSKDPLRKSGTIKIKGDYKETMSTHWFHDHMFDFTAQNVYKGNAAMMNYYSAIDRGNETLNDGVNLKLPSGSAMPWGNRDYDINLLFADKAWDQSGQLFMNPLELDGFIGDQILVNWAYKPNLDVRARRYRFRILNGSVARLMKFALVREIAGTTGSLKGPAGSTKSYEPVPFHLIANDGNIMQYSVPMDGTNGTALGVLPTQGIAERYDIVVDFAKHGLKAGDKVYFVNLISHDNGRKIKEIVPLANVLNETYKPIISKNQWINGDPGVGVFLRLTVQSCKTATGAAIACADPSMDPVNYVAGNKKGPAASDLQMIPLPSMTAAELAGAKHRTFSFGRSSGTELYPWTVKTDGGSGYTADLRRISAAPNLGTLDANGMGKPEIWHLETNGGWNHPVHIHFEEGQILSRNGLPPPIWEKYARKDLYRIGPDPESLGPVSVALRFREFAGTFVEHCHNTTHEDHAMLVRWDVEKKGQLNLMPAPVASWFGVEFVDSVAESTFRTGSKGTLFDTIP